MRDHAKFHGDIGRTFEPLLKCGDLTVFKMAAIRHLEFVLCVWTTHL